MANDRYVLVVALAVATAGGGCTTSQTALEKNPGAVGSTALCRTLNTTSDAKFRQQIYAELASRSVSPTKCTELVRKQNDAIAIGVAIAAVGVAAAVCANNDCGGGGYTPVSYGADWDQFYNQYSQLVWACREIATGRFTYDHYCAGKLKTDWRWPSKHAY